MVGGWEGGFRREGRNVGEVEVDGCGRTRIGPMRLDAETRRDAGLDIIWVRWGRQSDAEKMKPEKNLRSEMKHGKEDERNKINLHLLAPLERPFRV